MAMLPPRKMKTKPTETNHKQTMTPLQTLLQMGFPRNRAEKALAATGNREVQLASDWLLAHVNDTSLDTINCREYIVYVCPNGSFMRELSEFWNKSADKCGRNGAHNFMPHVTLISFFQAPDKYANVLVNILQSVLNKAHQEMMLKDFHLETYISSNFMGLFVNRGSEFLKKIAKLCAEQISELVKVQVEPHLKSLHLTLAYQFDVRQKEALKSLIKSTLNVPKSCLWELNLYSRDVAAVNKLVYKVVYAHVPQADDELELRIGDYIYVSKESIESSADGWAEGTSWLTGCNGYFPLCYTERTADSDTWTLNCSLPLDSSYHESIDINDTSMPEEESPEKYNSSFVPADYTPNSETLKGPIPRKIYICRHGERVDFTFGSWVPYSFDSDGKYIRKDLNMPTTVPQRHDFPNSYQTDTPLTCFGEYQAKLTGWGMKAAHLTKSIKYVYCSPSLRCVQTCHNILVGLDIDKQVSICVEPGIFEWLGWYGQVGIPDWMSNDELIDAGFNIDPDYVPVISISWLVDNMTETVEGYYTRCVEMVENLIKSTVPEEGDILLVGHACSLDTLSRPLLNKPPRNKPDFVKMVKEIPYCGLVTLMNDGINDWMFVDPPVPPLTNSLNKRFNWKVLTTELEDIPT